MNTEIILDENYKLVSDSYNWTLQFSSSRFDEDKQKEVKSSDEWHYPTIAGCIRKYINQSAKADNSVKDLLRRLDHIDKILTDTRFN